MEALLSFSILAIGLTACLEVFSQVQQIERRSFRRTQFAVCAQSKLVEISLGEAAPADDQSCPIEWSAHRRPLSPSLDGIVLHGIWREGHEIEETFEIVSLAR